MRCIGFCNSMVWFFSQKWKGILHTKIRDVSGTFLVFCTLKTLIFLSFHVPYTNFLRSAAAETSVRPRRCWTTLSTPALWSNHTRTFCYLCYNLENFISNHSLTVQVVGTYTCLFPWLLLIYMYVFNKLMNISILWISWYYVSIIIYIVGLVSDVRVF